MDPYNMPNAPYNSYNSYTAKEEKAPNIFVQFAFAFVPPKYRRLAKVKTGSMIGFVTLLVLLFALLSFGKLVLGYISFGGVEEILDEIPDFSLKNGRLRISDTWYLDEGTAFILVTDEIAEFTANDVYDLVDEGYEQVLLVSESGLHLYNDNKYQELDFKDFKDFSLDKDWITDTLMPIIWVIIAIAYLIGFVFGVLWYFGCAAIYMLIAMLMALIMGKQIPAGKLFRTAVYSKAVMYVIIKTWGLLPLAFIPFPSIVRILLTTVYLGFATWCTADPLPPANTQPPTNYNGYGGYPQ